MRPSINHILFPVFIVLITNVTNAQITENNDSDNIDISKTVKTDNSAQFWVNCGFGIDNNGLSFGGSLNFRLTTNSVFTVRYIRSSEMDFKLILFSAKEPRESVNDLSVLYGFCEKSKYVLFSVSTGAGLAFGSSRGRLLYTNYNGWFSSTGVYEENNFFTIGLPLHVQFFWTPSKQVGLGLTGFANINKNKSLMGVLLSIIIGEL